MPDNQYIDDFGTLYPTEVESVYSGGSFSESSTQNDMK